MKQIEYKGFVADNEIDAESGLIFGEVVGSRDMITFQGETVEAAVLAFRESIVLYLETCLEHGIIPGQGA